MKLRTHVASALTVAFIFIVYFLGNESFLVKTFYPILLGMAQVILDQLGHTWVNIRGTLIPRRNRLHSLPGVVFLGTALSLPFTFFVVNKLFFVLGCIVSLLIHYLEDMATESGVYIGKKKVRLPVTGAYDDPWINRLTVVASLLLLLMTIPHVRGDEEIIMLAIIALYHVSAL